MGQIPLCPIFCRQCELLLAVATKPWPLENRSPHPSKTSTIERSMLAMLADLASTDSPAPTNLQSQLPAQPQSQPPARTEMRSPVSVVLRIALGIMASTATALMISFVFRGWPHAIAIPVLFPAVVGLIGVVTGRFAAIASCVIGGLIFASELFEPLHSLQVQDDAARASLGWMLLAGLAISWFIIEPSKDGTGAGRRHEQKR